MNKLTYLGVGLAALTMFAQVTFADTYSAAIQSLSPGPTIQPKNKISFSIKTVGFLAQHYQITDSFSGSSVSLTNIDGGGNFSWVPLVQDVGTHTLTITARDYNDANAVTTQTITVSPAPVVTISAVAPGVAIMPGTKLTFHISSNGFTNPSYIVGDSVGSAVTDENLDSSGNFAWTPDIAQSGKHSIVVYASDSQGHNAQATLDIVVGAGPTVVVQSLSPGDTVSVNKPVTFIASAMNFAPTAYSVTDNFAGVSSISNSNINTSGSFFWTPKTSDIGVHILTIRGTVGAFGDTGSTTKKITVLGDGVSTSSMMSTLVTSTSTNQAASAQAASAAASGDTLSSLQNQLTSLLAQIHSQSSSTGTATGASLSAVKFTAYLKPGVQNDQVTHLQQMLSTLGYFTAEANGYYGPATESAVKKFQAAHNLDTLGVVGPGTRAALNALIDTNTAYASTEVEASAPQRDHYVFEHFMGYGDDDSDVLELQKLLSSLGFFNASPSGFYGNATVTAMKKFQTAHALTPAGYADKMTRAALNQ
jgi:peptidoglycan hydrolase-like protein with peptidoglycan-binding domain